LAEHFRFLYPIPWPLPQRRGEREGEMVGAFQRKAIPTPLSKVVLQGINYNTGDSVIVRKQSFV